jgi:hypothetical protein
MGDPFGLGISNALALPAARVEPAPYGVCHACGSSLARARRIGAFLICPECTGLTECEEEHLVPEGVTTGCLRIVGARRGYFQRKLFQNSSVPPSQAQHRAIHATYQGYGILYMSETDKGFPPHILGAAAELFYQVQRGVTYREDKRAALMAACLERACVEAGIVRSAAEIAQCLRLKNDGLAAGRALLHAPARAGDVDIDPHVSTVMAHVENVFCTLDVGGGARPRLVRATGALVARIRELKLAPRSKVRSIAVAATYIVLRRAGLPLAQNAVCNVCRVRKSTLAPLRQLFVDYHPFFVGVYVRGGVSAGREEPLD